MNRVTMYCFLQVKSQEKLCRKFSVGKKCRVRIRSPKNVKEMEKSRPFLSANIKYAVCFK